MKSLVSGSFDAIGDVFSDRSFFKRALVNARKLLPTDDSWTLGFKRPGIGSEITLTKDSLKQIDDWLKTELPTESVETITGELVKIDLDEYLRTGAGQGIERLPCGPRVRGRQARRGGPQPGRTWRTIARWLKQYSAGLAIEKAATEAIS